MEQIVGIFKKIPKIRSIQAADRELYQIFAQFCNLSEITADFIVIDPVVCTKTIICLFERVFRPISPVVYNSGTIYHKIRKKTNLGKIRGNFWKLSENYMWKF